jgi:hypothetical protein
MTRELALEYQAVVWLKVCLSAEGESAYGRKADTPRENFTKFFLLSKK